MSLTFIDLFAGIGGFRLGMEQAGHKCLGYVEWDKFARGSYQAIHNTEGEWTENDINNVKPGGMPAVDVWCFGFPCTDISIAGPQEGLEGARSGLFYKTIELLESQKEEDKPKYLFIENVKNLFSVNGGWDFARILISLDEAGYDAEWGLLNSKDFGVPQNRERVFIIGHSRRRSTREVFPIRRGCKTSGIKQVGNINPFGNGMNGNVYSFDGISPTLTTNKGEGPKVLVKGMLDIKGKDQIRRVYGTEGISPCLTTMQGGGQEPKILALRGRYNENGLTKQQAEFRNDDVTNTLTTVTKDNLLLIKEATKKGYAEAQIGDSINFSVPGSKTRRGRVGKGVAQTLDTSCNQAIIENKPPYRIRKLTPRECWRLQGFPDWAFDKAQEVNSNSQLYKQAGNSVTVPVIYEIAKRLV
ncbi:DNA cytosine methyltransferase [Bacillus toyonensis]|uniref:DNA cytosine methyltransferase n=1 Tax=Bacillus toyonensis TaxID=155322 RepID=UPI000BFE0505|nr:DNA cytosine methyltransferase [Bacillus toyonensis]PHD38285.1 DNA (cytosine-5-)-methyltransferase [Bacillus toyonensis]